MTKFWERFGPFIVAAAAPAAYFGLAERFEFSPSAENLEKLVEGVLNLAGILVGFLATSKALLFAVPDRKSIRLLKEMGAFSLLVGYLFSDILIWLAVAISALTLIFVQGAMELETLRQIVGYWLYLPGVGVMGFCRSMYLFFRFLRFSSDREGAPAAAASPPAPASKPTPV